MSHLSSRHGGRRDHWPDPRPPCWVANPVHTSQLISGEPITRIGTVWPARAGPPSPTARRTALPTRIPEPDRAGSLLQSRTTRRHTPPLCRSLLGRERKYPSLLAFGTPRTQLEPPIAEATCPARPRAVASLRSTYPQQASLPLAMRASTFRLRTGRQHRSEPGNFRVGGPAPGTPS